MKRNAAIGVLLSMSSGCFLITSGLSTGDIPDATSQDSASPDAPRPDGRSTSEDAGMAATDARSIDANSESVGSDASPVVDGSIGVDASPDAGLAIKLVWVTSVLAFGDFGGLAAADAICTNEAGKAAFAYVETSAVIAASRIPVSPTIEYRLPSGELAFSAGSAIGAGPLVPLNEVLLPVAGTKVSSSVWTGTNKSTCQDWTSRAGLLGGIGTTNSAVQWDKVGSFPCAGMLRLFCFQR